MKLVRFIAKAIHGDMLMQPGDEKMVEDSYGGAHVVDVATGQTSVAQPVPQAVFRADLAQRPPGSGMIVGPSTEDEARAFGKQFGGVIEAVHVHMWAEIDRLRAELAKALGQPAPARAVAPVSGGEGLPGPRAEPAILIAVGAPVVTLTPAQAEAKAFALTGGLAQDTDIIVPNSGRWQVENRTTGDHRLTVKTAGGAGVTLDRGDAAWVYADGLNVLVDPNAARDGAPANARMERDGRDGALARPAERLDARADGALRPGERPDVMTGDQKAAWLRGDGLKPGAPGGFAGQMNSDIIVAGRNAKGAGAPREAPPALDAAQQTLWFRGWDEANHDATTAARAGATGPVVGDEQTRIAAGFGNVYGSGTTGDQRGASAQPPDAALHDDGREARRAGRPRTLPDNWRGNALSDDDKAKWLAGWDEAQPNG